VNEGQAVDLIEETIRHVRAAGSRKLVWDTGERVSARFMDWYLASCGFEFGDGPEPTLPCLLGATLERGAGFRPVAGERRQALRVC
jgi:hypothetical protein